MNWSKRAVTDLLLKKILVNLLALLLLYSRNFIRTYHWWSSELWLNFNSIPCRIIRAIIFCLRLHKIETFFLNIVKLRFKLLIWLFLIECYRFFTDIVERYHIWWLTFPSFFRKFCQLLGNFLNIFGRKLIETVQRIRIITIFVLLFNLLIIFPETLRRILGEKNFIRILNAFWTKEWSTTRDYLGMTLLLDFTL